MSIYLNIWLLFYGRILQATGREAGDGVQLHGHSWDRKHRDRLFPAQGGQLELGGGEMFMQNAVNSFYGEVGGEAP